MIFVSRENHVVVLSISDVSDEITIARRVELAGVIHVAKEQQATTTADD